MPYIQVSFYNQEHQDKLKRTPKYKTIEKLVKEGFTCSNEDLWTYSLFKEQKNFDGYRNFKDLRHRLPKRWDKIEDYFILENYTVKARFPEANNQEMTEDLGIGTALALISNIHELTDADWNIIPVTRNKDLDFSINPNVKRVIHTENKSNKQLIHDIGNKKLIKVASDEERFIEVEAKCSYMDLENNASVSNAKADIEQKKIIQRSKQNNQNLLYGVITSYSANSKIIAHSRILDPPAIYSPNDNPRKLRLLSRLSFYLDKLNLISRANYLIALANRIGDITALTNYEPLDSRPLLNQRSERFEIPSSYTKSRTEFVIEENRGIGEVFPVTSVRYFFFGIDLAIPIKLIEQNFSGILEYRCGMPRSFNITVDAKVKAQELYLYRIDYSNLTRSPDRTRIVMTLSGILHSNSAGIIWGYLD